MYRTIRQRLIDSGMEAGEARAVTLLVMEKVCGMDTTAALLAPCDWGRPDGEHAAAGARLREVTERIVNGEPVQYALGEADFCGHTFHVENGVLIPRIETEELVMWTAQEVKDGVRLLDIGTGSGCIAVSLACLLPHAGVDAWDVSEVALGIAEDNAKSMGVDVCFRHVDVLADGQAEATRCSLRYDAIVSNPPYICREEASEMDGNVLDHEPDIALFVADDDPLLFYRTIASLALSMLKNGGRLFFEINRRFGQETVDMLLAMGYKDVELRQDQFGNDRMVRAVR